MFAVPLNRAGRVARFRALRTLYDSFGSENSVEGRAKKLLCEWLSPAQRDQFNAEGWFEVIGGTTGKHYRISYGTAANVCELDENGAPAQGLCVVPAGHLAPGDVMLTQKIALETSEAEALASANRLPARLGAAVGQPVQRPF